MPVAGLDHQFTPGIGHVLAVGTDFQADGRRKTPETLIMIDIDCHARGSFEGAVQCVEWLRENGFPGLFWCKSTKGRGIHAYVIVRKHQIRDMERSPVPSLDISSTSCPHPHYAPYRTCCIPSRSSYIQINVSRLISRKVQKLDECNINP